MHAGSYGSAPMLHIHREMRELHRYWYFSNGNNDSDVTVFLKLDFQTWDYFSQIQFCHSQLLSVAQPLSIMNLLVFYELNSFSLGAGRAP